MANNNEIERRRTFAIIAHPDAGKTSLTEKLLLVWWTDPGGGCGKEQQDKEDGNVGLDGY